MKHNLRDIEHKTKIHISNIMLFGCNNITWDMKSDSCNISNYYLDRCLICIKYYLYIGRQLQLY